MEKIRINQHPEWPSNEHTQRLSPVTILMKDGRKFSRTVEKVRGSPGNPLTRDELVDKYRSCAGRVLQRERLDQSVAALESLERLPEASDLMDIVTG